MSTEQTFPAVVLVGFEPDWEALYLNGDKIAEGHHVGHTDVLRAGVAAFGGRSNEVEDVQVFTTHVEEDEGNEYGEHEIPDKLTELPEGARSRISPGRASE